MVRIAPDSIGDQSEAYTKRCSSLILWFAPTIPLILRVL